MLAEQRLVGPDPGRLDGQLGWRARFPIQKQDMLDARAQQGELRRQRRQTGRHGDGPILRFVDHRREVGRRQAGVERVADHARAHDGVIDLEMVLSIPSQGGDPVARTEPQRGQCAGQAIAALAQGGIADPAGRPTRFGGHDLALAAPFGGVVQEFVYGQGVWLHQGGGGLTAGRRRRNLTAVAGLSRQNTLNKRKPNWRGGPTKRRPLLRAPTYCWLVRLVP